MLKLGAFLILLAAPARAVVVRGYVPAGPAAWAGAVAGAVSAAGTQRIDTLGSMSLSNLAAPRGGWSSYVASFPESVTPLARALELEGHEPKAFAALPVEARLAALVKAAAWAERNAAGEVEAAEAAVQGGGVRRANANNEYVRRLDVLAPYLDARMAARAEKVRVANAALVWERVRLIDAFNGDLAGKLAVMDREEAPLLERVPGGWRALDEHPDKAHLDVSYWAEDRLRRMEGAERGPWTAAEARAIRRTLLSPAINAALREENATAEARLFKRVEALEIPYLTYENDPSAGRAAFNRVRADPSGRATSAGDLRAVVAGYRKVLKDAAADRTALSWAAASLIQGWDGLIPARRLRVSEDEVRYAARRARITGAVTAVLSIAGIAATAVLGAPVGLTLAFIAVLAGSCIALAVSLRVADEAFTAELRAELDAIRGYNL